MEKDRVIVMHPKTLKPSEVSGFLASKTHIRLSIEEMDEAVAEAFRKGDIYEGTRYEHSRPLSGLRRCDHPDRLTSENGRGEGWKITMTFDNKAAKSALFKRIP